MNRWYLSDGPESDVVIGTRIRLSRNLAGIPFPKRMSVADRRRVSEKLQSAVYGKNSSLASLYRTVNMEELSKTEAVSLVERMLVSADFISERVGRSILVNGDESSCIMVNAEDHYVLQEFRSGLSLKEAYRSVDRLDTILNKSLPIAFDAKLGFLTQDPVCLGTGMHASLFLHLPALTDSGTAARLASNLSSLGLSLRAAFGSVPKPRGAIYQLSNNVTLGITEQEALANLNSMALQVIARERSARKKLVGDLGVKDTIWRSLGILRNARLLTDDEFFGLISLVRFGIAAGEIKDIPLQAVSELMIDVQPATLSEESGRLLTETERHALRASLVRRALRERKG